MESKKIAEKIVGTLQDKKAKDINVIDINKISILADYFIVCTGSSTTHIKALADEVEEKLIEAGVRYFHKEGYETARWILLDYGDVVLHIFHEEDRAFYNLERLWSDGVINYR
ncbi:MAG: ribosome silencing factor [Clostridia bacterium]|nr:ribosome silencing factor [Clostridia bacterium]